MKFFILEYHKLTYIFGGSVGFALSNQTMRRQMQILSFFSNPHPVLLDGTPS